MLRKVCWPFWKSVSLFGRIVSPHFSIARAVHELRYSALEVEYFYVFGLKCLVPSLLWLVRNAG